MITRVQKYFMLNRLSLLKRSATKQFAYPLILDDADQLGTNSVPATILNIVILLLSYEIKTHGFFHVSFLLFVPQLFFNYHVKISHKFDRY